MARGPRPRAISISTEGVNEHMALTEKPTAERTAVEDAAAKKAEADRDRVVDARTAAERTKAQAAAAASQLELQQLIAQRANALELGDEQLLHDADEALKTLVGDLGKTAPKEKEKP